LLKYLARVDKVPDGFTSNLLRYPIASLIYLPWLIIGFRKGTAGRFWLAALIPTGVNILGQTLWASAPYHLGAGLMSFLGRASVIWSIVGAFFLFPEERRLARSRLFWIGAVLTAAGFIFMSWPGRGAAEGASIIGIVIMLFCSICWGLYGVTVRYVMRDLDPLFVFSVIGGYTSIGLVMMAPLGDSGSVLKLRPFDLTMLILSSLLGIAAAHGLFYIAIQRIGVALSSLATATVPFVTLLGSAGVLGETFTMLQWGSGVVLVVGAGLATWSQRDSRAVSVGPSESGQ